MTVKIFTPRQRVIAVLNHETVDKIPFTVYETLISRCNVERILRNKGLCLVKRVHSYRIHYPDVSTKTITYTDEKKGRMVKTIYSTPYGDLTTLSQTNGYTTWQLENMFKTANDYKRLLFLIKNAKIESNYNYIKHLDKNLGDDFILRDNLPLEPMQQFISNYMGIETFSYEWVDNQDEVLKLYKAIVDVSRKIYPFVAESPISIVNYGGNVVPQVVGLENFKKYYIPHYNEAADILHKKAKKLGVHLDADNTIIMDEIANSFLDYIEAYDPGISPSLDKAVKKFKDKVLWINWPSIWHLYPQSDISKLTNKLIRDWNLDFGLIIGITEDVPEDRWQKNFSDIMDGIEL